MVQDTSGLTYLFGGKTPAGLPLDDTWTLTQDVLQELLSDTLPAARWGHAMETCFDAGKVPAVLFGGYDGQSLFDDTWGLLGNGDLMLSSFYFPEVTIAGDGGDPGGWVELAPLISPSARYDARMAGNILFGGYGELPEGGVGHLGDTWMFVRIEPTWQRLAPPCAPTSRRGHAMALDVGRNVIVLFGGETAEGLDGETWELDLAQLPAFCSGK